MDFEDDSILVNRRLPDRAKHFKDETDFKVVIENKFSPTSGTVEYESFFSEGEDPAKNDETVQTEAGVEDDIVPDHYYGDGKIPVFKPVSSSMTPLHTEVHILLVWRGFVIVILSIDVPK